MKKILPIIEVGRGISQGREFELWLLLMGYEIDAGRTAACYVNGENVAEDMEAAEIYQKLWDEFTADVNRRDK